MKTGRILMPFWAAGRWNGFAGRNRWHMQSAGMCIIGKTSGKKILPGFADV